MIEHDTKYKAPHEPAHYNKIAEAKRKYILYRGEHPKLEDGKKYTYEQLGAACGIGASAMRGRMRGRVECTDDLLWANGVRKPREQWGKETYDRLEDRSMKMMDKYMRRPLCKATS